MDSRDDYGYGYSPKGERLYALKSGRRSGRVNMIAGLCNQQLLAPFTIEGACNRTVFETWLETWALLNDAMNLSVDAESSRPLNPPMLGDFERPVPLRLGGLGGQFIPAFSNAETCLIPSLKPGQKLVIDNATFHKGGRIEELVRAAGCEVWYLPPYSPDLNKIERCWSWLKSRIRKGLDEFDTLREAMEDVLKAAS